MFTRLLQPGEIGKLRVKNRVISAPMEKNFSTVQGIPTYLYVDYVRDRARGGVGLVLLEAVYIDPSAKGRIYELGASSEKVIPALRKIVDAAHQYDTMVGVHLTHGGAVCEAAVTGHRPVGPSPVVAHKEMPRELTVSEIKGIIRMFGAAARISVAAGIDLIEIHGAHGYLIHQFFSPRTNKRTDEYGGTTQKRMRFPLEVVEEIRTAVGPDFPVSYRLSAEEFIDGGFEIKETLVLAHALQEAGINLVDVSAGTYGSNNMIVQPMSFEPGGLAYLARQIKGTVRVPVSLAGRINSPEVAERLLGDGVCDYVSIARALHADPEFVQKAIRNEVSQIRPCIACYVCVDLMSRHQPIKCAVNPRAGYESEERPTRGSPTRRVVVVGAGPGGMEAACVAAERGHRVTLIERAETLGGQLRYSSLMLAEYGKLISYYNARLQALDVSLKLSTEATASVLVALNPDVIVLATGANSSPVTLPTDGSVKVLPFERVLNERVDSPRTAVVFGGGGVGCLTAGFLAARKSRVTLVEPGPEIATDVLLRMRGSIMEILNSGGVKILPATTIARIRTGAVMVDESGVNKAIDDVDALIVAWRRESNSELSLDLIGRIPSSVKLSTVGDAVFPRGIAEAIREGYLTGTQL